jgi:uncharacterized protein YjiS (DUF1127 family)
VKPFTVRAQSAGYRHTAKAAPGEQAAPVFPPLLYLGVSMFKNLYRIRAAIARASIRRRTVRELNELPAEIQKDIGWAGRSEPEEIRLPF